MAPKPLNLEERTKIEGLLKDESLSLSAISRKIGRGKNTVVTEVRLNGGRDKYNAEKAQKRYDDLRKAQYEKLSKHNKGIQNKAFANADKISIIEMQLEIIIDQLNKLTKGK
jgi:IS30 family transposase